MPVFDARTIARTAALALTALALLAPGGAGAHTAEIDPQTGLPTDPTAAEPHVHASESVAVPVVVLALLAVSGVALVGLKRVSARRDSE